MPLLERALWLFLCPLRNLSSQQRHLLTDRLGLNFISTNVFFRQVRNLVFDTTDIPGPMIAVHWPSSQATSIQNCVFHLSSTPGDTHTGIFMEEGSGGLLNDLVFYGGEYGAQFGNQQYTMRNLTFDGAKTAILQIWNWGWTYKSLTIRNCEVGINMSLPSVGSAILLDSQFVNVKTALVTSRTLGNSTSIGSLVVENVEYTAVPVVLQGPNGQPFLLGDPVGGVYDGGYASVSLGWLPLAKKKGVHRRLAKPPTNHLNQPVTGLHTPLKLLDRPLVYPFPGQSKAGKLCGEALT